MMDAFDLASRLFGNSRAESRGDVSNSLDILTATGAGDSSDGAATVYLDADVTPADDYDGDDYAIGIPTSPNVIEGDGVLVGLTGSGPLKTPVVISNPGSGDRMQVQVDNAETLAEQAAGEVEQVRQDVADFRDDVATTYATKVERQDGDDAVRTFITTNYTNSNDLATTYATKTLVSQTKDAIELAASQTYETQTDAAATYATKSALTVGLDGIRSEVAEDYQPKGDYATTASMNSAIQQSASSIESSVAATYETKSDAAATYATKTEVQQTASGLDTRITTAQSTADGAYLERSGTGTTIDTTGAATIRSLVVDGQSVQDGTPTPSAPVPIVSVGPTSGTSIALCCGDPVGTYTTTPIDMQGHALRSLPDGTRDEMAVDSLGRVTMTQRVGSVDMGTLTWGYNANGYFYAAVAGKAYGNYNIMCTDYAVTSSDSAAGMSNGEIKGHLTSANVFAKNSAYSDAASFKAAVNGILLWYELATPQEIDLGKIDLPAPADTLWLDAAIAPTIDATWWTVGGIAGQQALEAEVTERQTLIRQFSGGVLAGYVGNAIAALVNAAGSFDVVRTAWTDGVPSILGTLARYAASGISLFDAAGNILAEFASDHVRIGGAIPEDGSAVATVCFFDSDADKGAMLTGYVDQSGDATQQTQDTRTQLRTRTHDADMPTTYGAAGESGLDVGQWLHAETGSYSTVESTATLTATADSGTDPTQTAHASASLGVKAVTVDDSAEEAYLTVNGNDVPMEQAIAALTTPLYSATVNASVSGTGIDAYTTGASVSLPAGTYLVIGAWDFNTATTSGTRNNAVALFRGSTYETQTRVFSAAQNYAALQVAAVMDITTQTTVSVRGASTRASNAAPTKIYALRVS